MVVNFTELLGREYAGKMGAEADQFIAYSVEGALRIEALLKALLGLLGGDASESRIASPRSTAAPFSPRRYRISRRPLSKVAPSSLPIRCRR